MLTPKKILTQINYWPQKIEPKIFLTPKSFDQKILTLKFFYPPKFLTSQHFLTPKRFYPKNVEPKNVWPQKIWTPKNVDPNLKKKFTSINLNQPSSTFLKSIIFHLPSSYCITFPPYCLLAACTSSECSLKTGIFNT